MKLNFVTKQLSSLGRWLATMLVGLLAIAFIWQGAFTTAALASPNPTLIASRDAGDQVQQKTREGARDAKGFIRDTANKVERTADRNASRVDRATDNKGSGGFFSRRAKIDRDRIHMRAEQDAARTQRAVDNSRNAVERAVDDIKDALD
ncbi:hypothetical protein H6G89_09570 [Oscillatoria sp. FACHB-1407]|uniref:hypothetical protein n=1 Tax=Oscillatoria sp. FACHB-1407 TaxID=2692847 RepID=UPI001687A503|nr:hypothetical protein [Oscillatoria sp. FACHB-1407]MBD2461294.1 hypothetical protein [Oscillatoria sp. FACHB-1407]